MSGSLTERLRDHVGGALDATVDGWWPRPPAWWPPTPRRLVAAARWRWSAPLHGTQLAEVVAHMALVVAAGHGLPGALERACARSHGAVAAGLREPADLVRDGWPAAAALRRWAQATPLGGAQELAVVAALPACDHAARLGELAAGLERRAHDDRLARLQWLTRLAWAVVALVVVGALL